ncbi:lysophospholipid acyltransferase family protein [Demetria terragena]|uniref:lysophospholipid acyltransferase family protein n=1 Tax=Demetria terragena TaxID=63959 RepID=UPI00035E2D69|nr:lysophospholipid acyltransferase family protein [Demetria terragena]
MTRTSSGESREWVYAPVIRVALGVFKAQGLKFTIEGAQHIPASGGAVIAMNHLSFFDYAYAGLPAREQGRIVRWMAKKEIFDVPGGGALMRGMKHIPVDRAAGLGAFGSAVAALRGGELVGVFPETTISRSLDLREFKTGAVRMAQEAGVPVIPLLAWGNHRVWTKDHPKRLGRSGIPISMEVGAPMWIDPEAAPVTETERLRADMTTILNRLQENYPTLPAEEQVYVPARLGGAAPTADEARELDQAEVARRRAKHAAKCAKKRG